MKEYNYTDIVRFDKNGIVLTDGETIQFEKCKIEWAKEKKIDSKETSCIAVRFSDRNSGHFIFYTNERIKLNFEVKNVSVSKTDILVHVVTDDGRDIETTMFHPFYILQ